MPDNQPDGPKKSPFENTFNAPFSAIDGLSEKPVWATRTDLAFNHLAFALDKGFLRTIQFFNVTKEIGLRNVMEDGSILLSKVDLTPEVFEGLRGRFLSKMKPTAAQPRKREITLSYTRPDDTVGRLRCERKAVSTKRHNLYSVEWSTITVLPAELPDASSKKTVRKSQKNEAARDYNDLAEQVLDIVDESSVQRKVTDSLKVSLQFDHGRPFINIENIPSKKDAKRLESEIQKKLSGVETRCLNYHIEDDDDGPSDQLWEIEVTRTEDSRKRRKGS